MAIYLLIQWHKVRLAATLLFTLSFSAVEAGELVGGDIRIRLDEPTFVMPQFSNPFMEREAGIAPYEYEMAEQLRHLLDTGDKEATIDALSTKFDLEMSPALLHLKAQIYFNLGEHEEAEATFDSVLMRMPQFIRAHSDLAQLYLVTDRPEKARHHFAQAVAFGERSPTVLGQLGYLNLKLHNAQSAIVAYQNALSIEPENIDWQQGLLAALTRAKQYDAAASFSSEMIAARPNNSELWLSKAFLHLQQDDNFTALACLETALALGNTAPENKLATAQLHMELDSYDRALELLISHMEKEQLDLALLNRVAAWLESKQRWDKLNTLLAASKDQGELPANDQSHYYLLSARAASGLEQHQRAADLYDQALAADPSNTDALLAAAGYFYSRKRYVQAESLYSRAEAFQSAEKEALLGRARIYIDLKDYRSALEVMRKIHSAYPDTPELARNISILQRTLNNSEQAL